jgi:hypothetical protein
MKKCKSLLPKAGWFLVLALFPIALYAGLSQLDSSGDRKKIVNDAYPVFRESMNENACLVRSESLTSFKYYECKDGKRNRECFHDNCGCIDDYYRFIETQSRHALPTTSVKILQSVESLLRAPIILEQIGTKELRSKLLDLLNVEFIFKQIESIPLGVFSEIIEQTDEYSKKRLTFFDPFVGQFKGFLFEPKSKRKYPVVIALHGHASGPEHMKKLLGAKDYLSNGIALLLIESRGICGAPNEDELVKELMLNGFSLLGLHVYETAVALKYLAVKDDEPGGKIDSKNVGLIGHSAGSTTGNVAVRIFGRRIKTFVTDQNVSYLDPSFSWEGALWVYDVPSLYPYRNIINQFEKMDTFVLPLPYGFEDPNRNYQKEIIQYFAETLK